MGTFLDLYRSLDPDPRIRGGQFEHVCKWFLANDPTYKNTLRRVWLWEEWSGRWGGDAGIDLVAEDLDGRLWAIQAKAYAAENTVTKKDVDKFLAESSRAVFSYRLLIATTDKLHHIARRTINDQEKKVFFVGLSDLITCEVDWPADPFDLSPSPPPKSAEPRDYQLDAIRDVLNGFRASDRGQLIMACGTGKTLTSLFIKEELATQRTLVLVPSLSLLKQTMQVWRVNATTGFDALPVCSDETVTRGEDEAVAHTSELGVPVTTDPGEIAGFLRRRTGPRVVFSTYQSCPQIAAAFTIGQVPAFDLVIADEAHRVAGPVSSDFAMVLDAAAIRARRRLFMTATPRYFTGRVRKAAQDADFEIASMDDPENFGTVFHRLTFGEAINRDLLTDYQVVVVGVTDDAYREWTTQGVLVTRDGKNVVDARTLAAQIGLAEAMRKYDLRRTISFHSRVARARDFVGEMHEVIEWMPTRQQPKGALWADYASGEMTAGERHVRLQHLSRLDDGERGLLANARCLAEGVDVPTLDGVAFIDPRRSEVDIVQAVGRAIRKAEDKTIGTIVIPVFIDTEADPEMVLDDSVFKPVWDVVKALRAHDDELAEQIDSLRRAMGQRRRLPKLPEKIKLDVPVTVDAAFAAAFEARLVEQTSASWEFWFGLLLDYVAGHGTALVPQRYKVNGYGLGAWVNKQRSRYSEGSLNPERQHRLAVLSGWSWDPKAAQWEAGFAHLLRYVEKHGDALVPMAYVRDGFPLGRWVVKQRSRGTKGELDRERRHRLDRLSGWSWNTTDDRWEQGYQYLLRYVEQTGHARIAPALVFEGYKLGQWVVHQRVKNSRGVLEPDRKQRLSVLPGWTWSWNAAVWDEGWGYLIDYVREHGHTNVPATAVVRAYKLGQWVSLQRQGYRSGKLAEDRRQRLDAIPEWTWNPIDDLWEAGFRHAQRYAEAEGTSRVPQQYETTDGFNLGSWVATQRRRYRKGVLEPDRIHRLAGLPGWTWGSLDTRFEEGLRLLEEFTRQHGHARIPRNYMVGDFNLGLWSANLRARWHLLERDRRRRLKALLGWSEAPHEARWETGIRHLREYVEAHGTAAVPRPYAVDGFPLGSWVMTKRQEIKNGKLALDRRKALEALPGWVVDQWEAKWENGFAHLAAYVGKYSHANPHATYTAADGYRLGAWVRQQRLIHRKGDLDPGRAERLVALPGWIWESRNEKWGEGYQHLTAYIDEHGDARVPVKYVAADGYRLGAWVAQQRSKARRGVLDPDRVRRLRTVGALDRSVADRNSDMRGLRRGGC